MTRALAAALELPASSVTAMESSPVLRATLAAACDVMRFHASSAWKEMTPIHKPLRQAPHHLILGALGGRPGVGE